MTRASGTAGTDLSGTRALITGATSGLGLAMASALAKAGATVLLTGRDAARAQEAAARLQGASGLALDVRNETSVADAVERAWSRLGGLDLLVNNAGLGMRTVNPRFMVAGPLIRARPQPATCPGCAGCC